MAVRGIRGATTVENDDADEIVAATRAMLVELIERNDLDPDEICGAWFTTTPDLRMEFPAVAARQLGWVDVPLLCGLEMNVPLANPRSIQRCIRALILINSEKRQSDLHFVYQHRAGAIQAELARVRAEQGAQR